MSKSIVYYGHSSPSIAGPRVETAQAFRVHEIREARTHDDRQFGPLESLTFVVLYAMHALKDSPAVIEARHCPWKCVYHRPLNRRADGSHVLVVPFRLLSDLLNAK